MAVWCKWHLLSLAPNCIYGPRVSAAFSTHETTHCGCCSSYKRLCVFFIMVIHSWWHHHRPRRRRLQCGVYCWRHIFNLVFFTHSRQVLRLCATPGSSLCSKVLGEVQFACCGSEAQQAVGAPHMV
jgi:hypothetical protein